MKTIYIASKTKHAYKWLQLRDEGVNIISTWIDEAGFGQTKDFKDLCERCIYESLVCDVMIVYAEEGEYLKGAFIEMGMALAINKKQIFLVGEVLPKSSTFTHCENVIMVKTVQEALEQIA